MWARCQRSSPKAPLPPPAKNAASKAITVFRFGLIAFSLIVNYPAAALYFSFALPTPGQQRRGGISIDLTSVLVFIITPFGPRTDIFAPVFCSIERKTFRSK